MPQTRPSLTTQRLEALSDGVIAIAATLLVLEIGHLETGDDESVIEAVIDTWPSFVAYLVSFSVIALIWVAHHAMFERICSVDRPLLFLNLSLLLVVGFIPWPTSLLADYIDAGGSDAAWATAVYSATMTAIGLIFMSMWWHLVRHPEYVIDTVTDAQLSRSLRFSLVSPIVYGLTIPLAFLSPYLCLIVYAALAGYFARGPSARALLAARENVVNDEDEESEPEASDQTPVEQPTDDHASTSSSGSTPS